MPARRGSVHVATTKRVYKGKTYVTHFLPYRSNIAVKKVRRRATTLQYVDEKLAPIPAAPCWSRERQALVDARGGIQ